MDPMRLALENFVARGGSLKPKLPADPHLAIKQLGLTLWSDIPDFSGDDKLIEICKSLDENPNTIVESGNGTGKSYTIAGAVCWWLETRKPHAKVVTLAPTYAQVNSIIWSYIRKFHQESSLTPEVYQTPRWVLSGDCFAIGLSPRKQSAEDLEALKGYHSPNLLVVMDEAPGLPRMVGDAIRGLATGEKNRVLAVGNPLEQAGPFYEATQSEAWNYINISCLNHPNVVLKRDVIPGAVSYSWVVGMIADHCRPAAQGEAGAFEFEGRWYVPGPVFMSRVLGKPPTEASDQLIHLSWVISAQSWVAEPDSEEEVIIGLDPARVSHGDSAAMVARKGAKVLWIKRRKIQSPNPGMEIAGWLRNVVREIGAGRIYIDATGIGASVVDSARNMGLAVLGILPGMGAAANNMANKRAEMYWRMRATLQANAISLPQDDYLVGDLCAAKYWYDGQGRVLIEPKDKIRDRLNRSPDSADALALTFAFSDRARVTAEANTTTLKAESRWGKSVKAAGWDVRRSPDRSRWRRRR